MTDTLTSRVDIGRRADGERFTIPSPGAGLLHTLVSGKTGSGKSSTVAKAVGVLADRENLAMVGVDFKGGLELLPWAPRFTTVATTAETTDRLLERLLAECNRRAGVIIRASQTEGKAIRLWRDDMGPRILFVIDEGREMTYSKDAIAALDSIAARSRALGMNVIISTQYALAKDFPSTLLTNLGHRICHRMGTLTQYATALAADQLELKEAELGMIPEDRPGICYVSGIPGVPDFTRCRSDYVPDDAIDRRAAATAHLRVAPEAIYQ